MALKHFNNAGIYGSKSTKLWDQTTVQNDFQSIATVVVPAAGQSSIVFSSIPQNYTHLQIRLIAKSADTSGTGGPNIVMQLGGATSDATYTNYYSHYLNGNGSSASSGSVQASGYYALVGNTNTSYSGSAGMFGANIIDILDYASTSKTKTIRSLWGHDSNGLLTAEVGIDSALWNNSSTPVQTLNLSIVGGANFAQYTQAALYGIKVAS